MMPLKHDGTLNAPTAVFFGDPRQTIGAIRSAESGVDQTHGKPWGCALVVGAILAVGAFFALEAILGSSVRRAIRDAGFPEYSGYGDYLGVVAGFFVFVPAVVGTLVALGRIPPTATYIGEHGIARYRRSKNGKLTAEVLRFAEIADVRVTQHVRTRKGARHTHRNWEFVDAGGAVRFKIAGSATDYAATTLYFKAGEGNSTQDFRFGEAAYRSWQAVRGILKSA
jgi:hypothetical protein